MPKDDLETEPSVNANPDATFWPCCGALYEGNDNTVCWDRFLEERQLS